MLVEHEGKPIDNAGAFIVSVGTLRASNGITYLVCISHNDGRTPNLFDDDSMYQVRIYSHKYQAAYEAACLDRFLNKRFDDPDIDIMSFNAEAYPDEDK